MKIDSLIIGNVTKDINIDFDDKKRNEIGGAVYYSSAAAYNMGHNIFALTKAKRKSDIKDMKIPQKRIIFIKGEKTCTMENIYLDKKREIRNSKALISGDSYKIRDIPTEIDAKIYHLAGLLYTEYSNEFMISLSKRSHFPNSPFEEIFPCIAVDAQGLVRRVNKITKEMYFKDYPNKKKLFPNIRFLKVDKRESDVLTGIQNKKDAAKQLFDFGAKEIMTTDKNEVQIYDGKKFYVHKIKSRDLIGRTGRGDTCFSTYICERIKNTIEDALLIAAATVSIKMESVGAFKNTRNDVYEYIKKFY